jgi:hypothetical protein
LCSNFSDIVFAVAASGVTVASPKATVPVVMAPRKLRLEFRLESLVCIQNFFGEKMLKSAIIRYEKPFTAI